MTGNVRQVFDEVRDKTSDFLKEKDLKPDFRYFLAGFGTFFQNIPVVFRLIAREPEILLFAAAQWLVIWLAYLAWTQMLYWIPDSVWQTIIADRHRGHSPYLWGVNLALTGWSLAIVAAASFPIGVLNAAMVAVHNLRASGETSTIGRSLAIAQRNLGRIWMFSIWDIWITVITALDRLPRKHGRCRVGAEQRYYAWKLATMGVLSSLVAGRGYLDAGKDSLTLLTSQPGLALGLRFGYSAVCWIVAIVAYMAAIAFSPLQESDLRAAHGIYLFYYWAAWPIMSAVAVVCVLVRPFFMLSVAQFYTDVFDIRADVEDDIWAITGGGQRTSASASWLSLTFLLLLGAILLAVFFRDLIGMTSAIEGLAH